MKFRLLIIFLTSFIFFSCGATSIKTGEIRIKGSDTMRLMVKKLAEEYMLEHNEIHILVEGGGSGLGIKELINNEIDICTSSRDLEAEEVKLIAKKFGSIGISTLIARDGIGVFVNKSNPVKNLSMEELRKIYLGEIANWNAINGQDLSILPIARNDFSGTALHFKTRVLHGQDFSETVDIESNLEKLFNRVKSNTNAIGFSGLGYQSDCKLVSINGVFPFEENIKDLTYPLSRYLHFYTISPPSGLIKSFIDWVLSPKGQKIIKEFGFVSLYSFSY